MKKFIYFILLFFSFNICYAESIIIDDGVSDYECPMGGAYNKIVYNTNGGNEIAPLYVASYNVKDFSFPVPVKEGYTFDGWYYDSSFTKKMTATIPQDVEYTRVYDEKGCVATATTILYAKWIKNEVPSINIDKSCPDGAPTFEVVYNTNGGNSLEKYTHCSGCEPRDFLLPTPKKSGYIFKGWYYDSSLKNKVNTDYANKVTYKQLYDSNGCTKLTKVVLYAKWEKEPEEKVECKDEYLYEIIYNTNNGKVLDKYSHCKDCSQKNVILPILINDGYIFGGWYYDSNYTQKVETEYANKISYQQQFDENGCVIPSSINLYAKWIKKADLVSKDKEFNVIFNTNGGNTLKTRQACITCDNKNKLVTPERAGYKFVGWYYDKYFINEVDALYLEELEYLFENDSNSINIYAKWEKEIEDKKISIVSILFIVIGILLILCLIVSIIKRKKRLN